MHPTKLLLAPATSPGSVKGVSLPPRKALTDDSSENSPVDIHFSVCRPSTVSVTCNEFDVLENKLHRSLGWFNNI
jgi:hypothetical protein